MQHKFFNSLDFQALNACQLPPDYVPQFKNDYDLSHFEEEFLEQDVDNTYVDKQSIKIIDQNQDMFKDF